MQAGLKRQFYLQEERQQQRQGLTGSKLILAKQSSKRRNQADCGAALRLDRNAWINSTLYQAQMAWSQLEPTSWEEDIAETDTWTKLVAAASNPQLCSAHRLLAAHQLLQHSLLTPESYLFSATELQPLVASMLDLAIEAERLPQVAVKVLWCLAATREGASVLEEHDAVPVIFGILRGTEDVLLAAPALQVLEQISGTMPKVLADHLCKANAPPLLLRSLCRWYDCFEIVSSLLSLFTFALSIPCHRTVVTAQHAGPGMFKGLRLPEVLEYIAQSDAEAPDIKETVAWSIARKRAASLARASAELV
eukprot:symbB.v1.2.010282.t2/scaffold619.1/size180033/18